MVDRTTTLIESLVTLCRDAGSKVGVVEKLAQDLDRVFTELKEASDDLAVVEAGGGGFVVSGGRVTRTGVQSFTSGVGASVTWQTEEYDDGGWVDIGGAPTVLTVPTGVTRVVVIGATVWDADATGDREARILKNGSTAVGLVRARAAAAGDIGLAVGTGVIDVVATDTFELEGFQDSGGALDLKVVASFLSAFALDA